jgi:hypothetical protein
MASHIREDGEITGENYKGIKMAFYAYFLTETFRYKKKMSRFAL